MSNFNLVFVHYVQILETSIKTRQKYKLQLMKQGQ